MNINQVKEVTPLLIKHNIVPFLWGHQGVGKTQVVKQVANASNIGFVHLHLATQEVGDLVGLLKHNDDGTVSHARPEWLPTEGRGILFLDELNRAHPDVIQACFSLITSRTIHTHCLPEGWKIVAAGNFGDDMTLTDTSDAAWLSRFCHIEFKPSSAEFVAFAESRDAFSVADFISEHTELLEMKGRKSLSEYVTPTPDRRSWLEMIAPLENESMEDSTRMEVYSGIVGVSAASRFITFKNTKERRIRLRDILRDYSSVREQVLSFNKDKDTRYDALSAPLQELEAKVTGGMGLEPSEVENLKKFFLDVPKELSNQTFKKLGRVLFFKGKNELLNDPEFTKRLVR